MKIYRPKKKIARSGHSLHDDGSKSVRFELLAKVSVTEQTLIRAGIEFIAIYKGEEYKQGAYLIEIYTPALQLGDNFIKPMQEVWANIIHPRGNIRQK